MSMSHQKHRTPAHTADACCAKCGTPIPCEEGLDECPRCLLEIAHVWQRSLRRTEATDPSGAEPPRLSHYRLLERIGEGAASSVWRAEQTGKVTRCVALKLLKPSIVSPQVVARFEAERQTLAMMDHPNIARVFDAGADENGRPFIAMELVSGVPLTVFCSEQALSLSERVQLMTQVCRGVQHAHQKGVIHRDLKPANILVTVIDGRPVAKVIDFGVAKVLEESLDESLPATMQGQLLGTIQYMSPEQAELGRLSVDTRSDIYSLGVLLYELMTEAPPFADQDAGYLALLRRTIEEDPPRPSLVMAERRARPTRAKSAMSLPGASDRLLVRDLDWIVMKALEKQPARRHPSVEALAIDLERALAHQPVSAGPPSPMHSLRKFVRRHKAASVATAGITVALAGGLALSWWQMNRARQAEAVALAERAKAEHQREDAELSRQAADERRVTAEKTVEWLEMILTSTNPWSKRGSAEADHVLDTVLQAVESDTTCAPAARLTLLDTLWQSYYLQAIEAPMERVTRLASRIALEEMPSSSARMEALFNAVCNYEFLGKRDAVAELLGIIKKDLSMLSDPDPNFWPRYWLIHCRHVSGIDPAEALRSAAAAQEACEASLPQDDLNSLMALGVHAHHLALAGEVERAAALFQRRWDLVAPIEDGPYIPSTALGLAALAVEAGKPDEATSWLQKGFSVLCSRTQWGSDQVLMAEELARHYLRFGPRDQAAPLLLSFAEHYEHNTEAHEMSLHVAQAQTASVLALTDQPALALPLSEKALESCAEVFGPWHEETIIALCRHASCLLANQRVDEAAGLLKGKSRLFSREPAVTQRVRLILQLTEAQIGSAAGRHVESARLIQDTAAKARSIYGDWSAFTLSFYRDGAPILAAAGDNALARQWLRHTRDAYRRLYLADSSHFLKLEDCERKVIEAENRAG